MSDAEYLTDAERVRIWGAIAQSYARALRDLLATRTAEAAFVRGLMHLRDEQRTKPPRWRPPPRPGAE